MLQREFTYENFDGVEVKESFLFNLNKAELMKMHFGNHGDDMEQALNRIVAGMMHYDLLVMFQDIILKSVGEKSADGRRFVKSDAISKDFESCPAYSDLYMELASDAEVGSAFIRGIMPAGMSLPPAQDALPAQDASPAKS